MIFPTVFEFAEADFHDPTNWKPIPYPSDQTNGRTNAGFVDLRDKPELVDQIPEIRSSPAMAEILRRFARTRSKWFTLGCDLGEDAESVFAGGYIEIGCNRRPSKPGKLAERVYEKFQSGWVESTSAIGCTIMISPAWFQYVDDPAKEFESVVIFFNVGAESLELARQEREKFITQIGNLLTEQLKI